MMSTLITPGFKTFTYIEVEKWVASMKYQQRLAVDGDLDDASTRQSLHTALDLIIENLRNATKALIKEDA